MLDRDSDRLPPALRRISGAFRLFGWASVWCQGILAIVATGVLGFSSAIISFQNSGPQVGGRDNPGAGAGLFLAILGLLCLYAGTFWAFRYTRLSRKLKAVDGRDRPKPADVIRALRIGLITNLTGMLLTILGGEALIGALVAKAVSQPENNIGVLPNITQAIQELDIWVVQANTHIILAHFIGICISLWLVQVVGRQ